MDRNKKHSSDPAEVRQRAEDQFSRQPKHRARDQDPERLLQELQIHQIELQIQNEELRAARNEVDETLHRYSELFAFAPVGYLVLNREGIIKETNRAAQQMLARTAVPTRTKYFRLFLASESRPAFEKLLAEVLLTSGEGPSTQELELLTGGQRIHVLATAVFRPEPEQTILLAMEDISTRKEAEFALRDAERRKDEFLAVLSHELRNPLMPIRMSLDHALRAPGPERLAESLAIIDRQVSHLQRIVNDLLEVTRITRGRIELQRETLDLREQVGVVIHDYRGSFDRIGVTIASQSDETPLWVYVDRERITQIVGNLFSNCAKFTPRGGQVNVSMRHTGHSYVELQVRDNGEGMIPTTVEHAFEPFSQQSQSKDRPFGGLGLGLAMVKGLVELHGGTVLIASKGLGQGTTVSITLPLVDAPAETQEWGKPTPAVRSHRILIIEDTPDAAEALSEVLSLEGHEVRVAANGPEGIACAHEFHPEVVLCDIGLPGMDGYQIAKTFRSTPELSHTHLIALSGYALAADIRRALDSGFDRHLAKPIGLNDLKRLLASCPPNEMD
ncbi:MAG: response regulator [Deltaproteobacteria bacterium]|nr:response regulator [Deltaproteobacteria bacterium]